MFPMVWNEFLGADHSIRCASSIVSLTFSQLWIFTPIFPQEDTLQKYIEYYKIPTSKMTKRSELVKIISEYVLNRVVYPFLS